jgi:hypothetical protein
VSAMLDKAALLSRLRRNAEEALVIAEDPISSPEDSARAIALSLSSLLAATVADEERSYDRERAREGAFAAQLRWFASGEGRGLSPEHRNACLEMLARWLDEGYDGPPTGQDYHDAGLPIPHADPPVTA